MKAKDLVDEYLYWLKENYKVIEKENLSIIRTPFSYSNNDLIEIILENARSGPNGEIGDGKIFVTNIEEVLRIRTGERGEIAL